MTYEELKKIMHKFRIRAITRAEMTAAIALWQLKQFGKIGTPDGYVDNALNKIISYLEVTS